MSSSSCLSNPLEKLGLKSNTADETGLMRCVDYLIRFSFLGGSLGESEKPCELPARELCFKAYAGNKPYLPENTIPHGTELRFHCDPFAKAKLSGFKTSKCNNGKWSEEIPHCNELDAYDPVVKPPPFAENHVSPDGYLNVDPGTLLKLECESFYNIPNITTHPEIILQSANRKLFFSLQF